MDEVPVINIKKNKDRKTYVCLVSSRTNYKKN